jgi:hypothetical protein
MPGAWIWNASLAADGDVVWWATTRKTSPAGEYLSKDDIWLGATSPIGRSIVEPARVAPDSKSRFDPDVVVTPSAIVAKLGGFETLLRRYDRNGVPLGDPYKLVVDDGGHEYTGFNDTALVPTFDGGVQFIASLQGAMTEVGIVGLDASGMATMTTFLGTPNTTEPGGSQASAIAAAARPDGSTLLAWDRHYNGCISTRPSETFATAFDGATVGAIDPVHDVSDQHEAQPAIAASGTTAYLAWQESSPSLNSRIALAKLPDVATVIAEIGEQNKLNTDVSLTLAGPGRGAIMYRAGEAWYSGPFHVVAFQERAGSIELSAPRVVPQVNPVASTMSVGLVHVGNDRYVVGWIESGEPARLYAMQIDLAKAVLRPAPAFEPAVAAVARQPRNLRCP